MGAPFCMKCIIQRFLPFLNSQSPPLNIFKDNPGNNLLVHTGNNLVMPQWYLKDETHKWAVFKIPLVFFGVSSSSSIGSWNNPGYWVVESTNYHQPTEVSRSYSHRGFADASQVAMCIGPLQEPPLGNSQPSFFDDIVVEIVWVASICTSGVSIHLLFVCNYVYVII